jgi:hypothetical protein
VQRCRRKQPDEQSTAGHAVVVAGRRLLDLFDFVSGRI